MRLRWSIGMVALSSIFGVTAHALTVEEFETLTSADRNKYVGLIAQGVYKTDFASAPQEDKECIARIFQQTDPSKPARGIILLNEGINEARQTDPVGTRVEDIVFRVMRDNCSKAFILEQMEAGSRAFDRLIQEQDEEIERLEAERERMLRCARELPDGRKVFQKAHENGTYGYVFEDGANVPRASWDLIRPSTDKLKTDSC